ncbi:hypothetical protein DFQ27_004717 [Actinomortierella ambigua]|uniref:Phorbol-ester/DAG-type domain-containing protein n=1 Tax=Actinomortierella ambigua TaxID=1343610 RepID=A0A9P6QLI6_9FUNG|nr:hypothetical protein DFQ27_004717 [Actinomortierella ambigua]
MTCEGCGFNCHHKCAKLVYNNCIRSMYIPGQDDNKKKKSRRTGASTEGSIPAAVISSSQPLQTVPSRSSTAPLAINTSAPLPSEDSTTTTTTTGEKGEQERKQKEPSASLGFLEDAIISAAIRMTFPSDLSSLPKNDHPPLTIQATTINFTRFVHKTTGLFWFQDRVEDIFTWKDPWNTTFVMVLYCFVCIYPMLLFLLPQCILATILIYFFQQKSLKQQQRILHVRGTNAAEEGSGGRIGARSLSMGDVQEYNRLRGKESSGSHQHHHHNNRNDDDYDDRDHAVDELDSATSSESEEEKQERQSLAMQYMSNLQHIQNMMGDVSDAHDKLRPLLKHLDWSDETQAIALVQGCLVAGLGMSVAMWFVPWRHVFMVGGVSTMLANSPWGKIVLRELVPVVHEVVTWTRTQLANKNH